MPRGLCFKKELVINGVKCCQETKGNKDRKMSIGFGTWPTTLSSDVRHMSAYLFHASCLTFTHIDNK